mmetsp:Transcript_80468/g.230980  ORF Transcript_80468/g.230980 Transcript_80468/m.230980 type:complete len:321 (+) Transcript_80468:73-1035(+)
MSYHMTSPSFGFAPLPPDEITRASTPDWKYLHEEVPQLSGAEGFSASGPPTPPMVGQLGLGGFWGSALTEALTAKLQKLEETTHDKTLAKARAVFVPPPGLERSHTLEAMFVPPLGLQRSQPKFAKATPPPWQPSKAVSQGFTVSAGSVGHPETCLEACQYVKRKGGCKEGAACTRCHLCFWQRPGIRMARGQQAKPVDLVAHTASSQHLPPLPPPPVPSADAAASRQTAGAKQAQTQCLHERFVPDAVVNSSPEVVAVGIYVGGGDGLASLGSIGHPHACEKACKYHSKGKGCKDGHWCVRCHVCQWRRESEEHRVQAW